MTDEHISTELMNLNPESAEVYGGRGERGDSEGRLKGIEAVGMSPVPITPTLWREFRIPASDLQGHSERFYGKLPPGVMGQVSQVIQAKQFPYRSISDLLRHAVWRHLKWLGMLTDEVPSVTAQVDAIMEIVKEEEFQADFQQTIEATGTMANRLIGNGDVDEAKRMLIMIRNQIDLMPEGHWKRRYQAEFDQRWGYQLHSQSMNGAGGRAGNDRNDRRTGPVYDHGSGEIVEFR